MSAWKKPIAKPVPTGKGKMSRGGYGSSQIPQPKKVKKNERIKTSGSKT